MTDTTRDAILNPQPCQPSELLLHTLFTRNDSNAVALRYLEDFRTGYRNFTYNDVDSISNHYAKQLVDAGIKDSIVPVILPQCPQLYIALLTILKSGNAYCPILPDTPRDRIDFIIKDVDARAIITANGSEYTSLLNLSVDLTKRLLDPDLGGQISTTSLAYVMYTSGTTGVPKAVQITHASSSTSILAHDEIFEDCSAGDTLLQFANSTFDISIFEIFSAWAHGLTLVSVERSLLLNRLTDVIEDARIAYMELTPSVAALLPEKSHPQMASVKVLVTIGEMLTKQIIHNWAGKLFNAYGPTEATLHASYARVDRQSCTPSNIGRPLHSCTIIVLEPEGKAVQQVGAVGELCIAGPQVSVGYLNRAELNEKAFISHPAVSGMLYRTGDLASIDDGQIYFIGRKDDDTQIKVNGQRVELGELAHTIQQDPNVRTCFVLQHKKRIYAFLVPVSDARSSWTETRLPYGIVPTYLVLDTLPTSASGKIDQRTLRDLAERRIDEEASTESTSNGADANEPKIGAAIKDATQIRPRPNQSFRSLGLDSLGAIKVVVQLKQAGLHTTVFDVLDSDNIASLASRLKAECEEPASLTDAALNDFALKELRSQYPDGCKYKPASSMQSSMIAATLNDPAGELYLNHIHFTCKASTHDVEAGLHKLVIRHSILRTGFHASSTADHDFIQIIYPSESHKPRITIVAITSDEEAKLHLHDHTRSLTLSDSNIARPALHFQILSTSAQSHVSMSIHHALYDAWSLELILHDLDDLLSGTALVSSPVGFDDIVLDLEKKIKPTKSSEAYWSEVLGNIECAPFPPLAQSFDKATQVQHRETLEMGFSAKKLDIECARLRTNPQILGQLVWAYISAYVSGQESSYFAVTTSGRALPIPSIETVCGPLIQTFPFIWESNSVDSVAQILDRIGTWNNQCTKHTMPYRDILRSSLAESHPDTLFIYQKSNDERPLQQIRVIDQEDRLDFRVLFSLERAGDSMSLQLQAKLCDVSAGASKVILQQASKLLEFIFSCDADIACLNDFVMPASLQACANKDPISSVDGRLDLVFDSMARLHPSWPALQFYNSYEESKIWTYIELERIASSIAFAMQEAVRPKSHVVAICLDKSVHMYASILAILKFGCAYVALEPALPDDRIAAILKVTSPDLVLTSKEYKHRFKLIKAITVEDIGTQTGPFPTSQSNELAYIIMTSGTTGLPKACAATHSNVLSNCDALGRIYPWVRTDRMMQFTSYAFDVSVFEIFFTWINGMCLVSAPKDLVLSDITRALNAFSVTHLNMTPTAAALIKAADLPTIKCFITSGEATSRSIIADWGERRCYFNAYGPTETTNVCNARLVQFSDTYPSAIGPLFDNSSGFVLDSQLNILPLLAQGELYVGGAQVIAGYFGNAELTSKSFITHESLGRLYRTGDVVRMLEDGFLSICGRIDTQVKIRGHRIELEEINHTLRSLSDVLDAATIVKDESLISFIQMKSSEASLDKVFQWLDRKLPSYMIPAYIRPVDKIPLTSSYKLDSRSLLSLMEETDMNLYTKPSQTNGQSRHEAWTDKEKMVAEVLSQVCSVPLKGISRETTLSMLGLDSISAIKITNSLRKREEGQISVSAVMRSSSVSGIAAALTDAPTSQQDKTEWIYDKLVKEIYAHQDAIVADLNLQAEQIESMYPCSSIQEGILLETLKDAGVNYVNSSILTLDRPDSQQLKRACMRLVHDHSLLRTCFAFTDQLSIPCVQVVLKADQHTPMWMTRHGAHLEDAIKDWQLEITAQLTLSRPPVSFLELIVASEHYLVISLHHSLFDGWSLDLLHSRIESYYEDQIVKHIDLTDIRRAVCQSSFDQGPASYWADYLSRYEPFTLPILSRTSKSSMQITTYQIPGLESMSRQLTLSSSSLLAALQLCWATLLSQISGVEDVCFANVVSGRTLALPDVDQAVIPLFNVLPVRANLGQGSSQSRLHKLHQHNLKCLDNPHYPLRRILQAAKMNAGETLFDTILILQKPEESRESHLITANSDLGDSNYTLMLEVTPDEGVDVLHLRLTANTDRISQSCSESLAQQFESILRRILSDEHQSDGLMSISEAAATVDNFEPLNAAFERNVQTKPAAKAIEYIESLDADMQTITYADLGALVDTVCSNIWSLDLTKGQSVIVMLTSLPELVATFYALLRLGLVYAPLSPDTPSERLRMILSELKPGLAITDENHDTSILSEIVACRSVSQLRMSGKHSPKAVEVQANDLAYIIHTSGSTGRPKGVMIEHRNALAAIRSSKDILRLSERSRWLQFASLTFDMSIYDMLIALSYGICLVGAAKGVLLADLTQAVRRLGATHLDLTPAIARTLKRAELPSVELLFCIGERLSQSTIREWGSICMNVYGPSEASMACTYHNVADDSLSQDIGCSFVHAQLAIFHQNSDVLVPLLSLGKLCIAGPQIGPGYLNAVEDSYFSYEGIRFYRTGDLCRMLPDKSLAFVDRKDNQTKLRGLRIELDEISTVLLRGPILKSAVTLVLRHPHQQLDQLVAFICYKNNSDNSSSDCVAKQLDRDARRIIEEDIAGFLPLYMMPASILEINHVPLGAAGKADRKLLTSLWLECLEADEYDSGPVTEMTHTEQAVAAIFAKVSGVGASTIRRDTSIYHLGLDSISAIQIVSGLKRSKLSCTVMNVLQNPKVSQLATVVSKGTAQETTPALSDLPEYLVADDLLPCTPVQENMIAQSMSSHGKLYYNHVLLKLDTAVDQAKLKDAWTDVYTTTEILRAGFIAIDRPDCQYALKVHSIEECELPWSSDQVAHERLDTYLDNHILSITDQFLEHVDRPALKLHCVETEQETFLLFSAHHAIFDGSTLQRMFADVQLVMEGKAMQRQECIKVSAQKLYSLYNQHGHSQEYWTSFVEKTQFIPFPNLNSKTTSSRTTNVVKYRSSASEADIVQQCKAVGVSLSNAAMVSWAKILSAYSGESSITFGTVLSGRTGLDLANTSYPCVTTVPQHCMLTGSCSDVLNQVKSDSVDALKNQHVNLTKVKRSDGTALFDTLFVYQKHSTDLNTNFWTIEKEFAAVEAPVSIEISHQDSCIDFILTYTTSKLNEAQGKILLQQFDAILNVVLTHPDEPVLDLEIHVATNMLSIQQPKVVNYDTHVKLLHQFVEHNAETNPHSTALEFTDDLEGIKATWSYEQLNGAANHVAHYLVNRGIEQQHPIAICFEKSPMAFICILAVLKTGSAFCCLDANAPMDRRAFIISNCKASMVLCSDVYEEELTSAVSVPVIPDNVLAAARDGQHNLDRSISEDDLSYILFTSGSTGTPKGCCISHKSIVQAMYSFRDQFCQQYDTESRFLAFASLHFDVSILEQYFSWSIGARVCAAPRDVLLSDIPGAIKYFGITHLDLTPQLAMTLLPEDAKSLRVFITGGEMLRAETVDHWGGSGVLFNFYGPTEVTIGCTALKRVEKDARPSNIGQPWLNCGIIVQSVLGKAKPALRGAIGDLIVSGSQVGAGYMDLPDATKKRFAFSKVLNDRTYATGDLVRLLADDSLDFAGRADSQIKLRGQRIETGEIDSVLKKSDTHVSEAVTVVLKHPSQQKDQLVSFVVWKDSDRSDAMAVLEARNTETQLRACQEALPPYMIPSFLVPVNRIALTATHKVDTKKLRVLYDAIEPDLLQKMSTNSRSGQSVSTPADPETLEKVRSVTQRMTGVTDMDDDSSIFELGLDSVSVVGLVRQLRLAGLQTCSVAVVMGSVSVNDLARKLSAKGPAEDDCVNELAMAGFTKEVTPVVATELNIAEYEIQNVFPCPPLIEGMIVESLKSSARHMNTFKVSGDNLNIENLEAAFADMIQRTPMLRSRFVMTTRGLAHVIVKYAATSTKSMDFPLLSSLIEIKTHSDSCDMTLHHALYDGQSLEMLFDDLNTLYASSDHKERPTFTPVLSQMLRPSSPDTLSFWSDSLQGRDIVLVDRLSEKIETQTSISVVTMSHLESLCKAQGCVPVVILQIAWAKTLQFLFEKDSIFGLLLSGRDHAINGIEDMMYPTFNTVPVFCATKGTTNEDVIRETQRRYGTILGHQHTPLRDIKKLLKVNAKTPLMDSVLVFQRGTASERTHLIVEDVSTGSSGYALALDVTANNDKSLHFEAKVEDCGVPASQLLEIFDIYLAELVGLETMPLGTAPKISTRIYTTGGQTDNPEPINLNAQQEAIWKQVLETIGATDQSLNPAESFFTLGLDSVDIIKLSARLKQSLKVKISVAEIMANPYVTALSSLKMKKSIPAEDSKSPLLEFRRSLHIADADTFETILPVSPIQNAMLALSAVSENGLYLNHALFKLDMRLTIPDLQTAWTKLISSHEVLRTSFRKSGRSNIKVDFMQVVHKDIEAHLPIIETSNLDQAYNEHKGSSLKKSKTEDCVPLFACVIKDGTDCYLALSIHHCLYDGISLGQILSDLDQIINGKPLDSRPAFSLLLEHIYSQSAVEADLYWDRYLAGCSPRLLFEGELTKDVKSTTSSKISITELANCSKTIGVTIQALAQACYAVLLAEIQGQKDVLFGTIHTGRTFDPAAADIAGPCMNTITIRAQIDPSSTYRSLIQDLHQNNIEMADYVYTPLKQVQDNVGKGPLFETLFVYQNARGAATQLEFLTPIDEYSESSVEFPLAVEASLSEDALQWTVAMQPGYCESAETIFDKLEDTLQKIVQNSNQLVVVDGLQKQVENISSEREELSEDEIKVRDILLEFASATSEIHWNTSIFSLGLDSISVIQLSRRLKQIELKRTVGQILRSPTLRGICQTRHQTTQSTSVQFELSNEAWSKAAEALKLEIEAIEDIAPATASQAYFLTAWKALEGTRFMSNFVFNIVEEPEKVKQRWIRLVQTQAIMRTAFATINGELYQVVLKQGHSSIRDFSATSRTPDVAISEFLQSDAFVIPRLDRPPAHLTMLRCGDKNLVILSIHHALYDANSISALLSCLARDTEPSSVLYAHLSKNLHGELRANKNIDYWTRYLSGVTPLKVANNETMAHLNSLPQVDYFSIKPDRPVAVVDKKSKEYSVTSQSILIAAIAKAIVKQEGSTTMGVYISGRSLDTPGIDEVFGPVVNILPIRVDNVPEKSIRRQAESIHAALIDMNGIAQHQSIHEISKATGLHGLVDVSINILPRTNMRSNLDEALDDYGRFSPSHIATIRERYQSGTRSSIDGYTGLGLIEPRLDIEVEIVGDQVNFGVFASSGVLDESGAELIISSVWQEIQHS